MRHKIYFLLLFFTLATACTIAAQTCPGPAVRTALINLQKSNIVNGTRWGQTVLTDTCGNQRYVTLDSLIVIITDSIAADTALQYNWYTRDATTTDAVRTATILESAQWLGTDPAGYLLFQMGDLVGSNINLDNTNGQLQYFSATTGANYVDVSVNGIELTTSPTASRAVHINSDTVNTVGSFDPTNFRLNFNSDNSYLYADSLKVVGLGQFPAFPSLNFDGTEKGVFYSPASDGVILFNGVGDNILTRVDIGDNSAFMGSEIFNISNSNIQVESDIAENSIAGEVQNVSTIYEVLKFNLLLGSTEGDGFFINQDAKSPFGAAILYFLSIPAGSNERAFGVSAGFGTESTPSFDWFQVGLPTDTLENSISFYNHAYYWKNEHPIGTANTDTLLHFWAATGPGFEAGKDPGFMTLDQVRGGGVNWYNANGTTTDNSRIADVLETATWRSDNVTEDGIVPFRFELAGVGANEPENMVWLFPNGDSAMIRQRDSEIELFTNSAWVLKADLAATVQADSFTFNPNLGGNAFRVGRYNVVTQNSDASSNVTHKDAIEYNSITGTAQTELFLDGSSAVFRLTQNSNSTFKVHISAICSAAGNGVGITTGESFSGWYLGGIKRVGATTALVGTVQNAATAQADTGMSTSVVTIDADDTDDSLRIRFTPPSTAGSTTVIQVTASIETTQSSY